MNGEKFNISYKVVIMCIITASFTLLFNAFPQTASKVNAAPGSYLRQPTGYHGILWGTEFSEVSSRLREVAHDSSIYMYVEASKPIPKEGVVSLTDAKFIFQNGKFTAVILEYPSGIDSFIEQMHILYLKHGPGQIISFRDNHGNQSIASISWFGDTTFIKFPKYEPGKPVYVYMSTAKK